MPTDRRELLQCWSCRHVE